MRTTKTYLSYCFQSKRIPYFSIFSALQVLSYVNARETFHQNPTQFYRINHLHSQGENFSISTIRAIRLACSFEWPKVSICQPTLGRPHSPNVSLKKLDNSFLIFCHLSSALVGALRPKAYKKERIRCFEHSTPTRQFIE